MFARYISCLSLVILFLFEDDLFSQQTTLALYRYDSVKVTNQFDVPFVSPWTGGYNFCQVGELDINLDGTKDILVFDRSGDRVIPLIYAGNGNEVNYKHDFQAAYKFPHLEHFALSHDFNCDGKEDLFTYNNTGFQIYKNTSNPSVGLQFDLYINSLESDYGSASIPIYVIPIDVPCIEDIDNDGDTDMLVFNILGSCVEYHRNYAMENLGRCDTLILKLETDNWGVFTENFSNNQVTLNDSCDHTPGATQGERHAGSSLMAYDSDGDGDKDLLLGDISYKTISHLINGGTAAIAKITSQIPNFPVNTPFIDLPVFPAPFYLDVNHDGKKDLVVCPNSETGSENHTCIWYYLNEGTTEVPEFRFIKNNLIVEETIDVGEGAIPAFFDYNRDGKCDLVVGNYGYFQQSGNYKSRLALFENTGTVESPEFKLVNADFANLGSLSGNSVNFYPTFGDVDGDGDEDMITGNSDGRLFLFENTAAFGMPANLNLSTPNFQNIDVGTFAAPNLVDVDLDGKLDLLVGSRNGSVSYYRNTGTSAAMTLELQTDRFGNVSTNLQGEPNGFSTPLMFRKNGLSYLICGSQSGYFRIYGNIDNNLSGSFELIDSLFLGNRDGERTSMALRDITADGFPDAITGNYAGGLVFYKGEFPSSSTSSAQSKSSTIVYPNPGGMQFTIRSFSAAPKVVSVFNLCGKLINQLNCNADFQTISTDDWSSGVYLIQIVEKNQIEVLKWVKL
jgi:hypothetical protein